MYFSQLLDTPFSITVYLSLSFHICPPLPSSLHSLCCVVVWIIYMDLSSSSLILYLFVLFIAEPTEELLYLYYLIFIPNNLTWFFLIVSIPLLKFSICSWKLSTFPTGVFNYSSFNFSEYFTTYFIYIWLILFFLDILVTYNFCLIIEQYK